MNEVEETKVRKSLEYLPSHQRLCILYILNKKKETQLVQDSVFSIDNSLELLKTSDPMLYNHLSEKKIKFLNEQQSMENNEDTELFIIDKIDDSESDTESESESLSSGGSADPYDSENDFSD
jgi:hypothetical protein